MQNSLEMEDVSRNSEGGSFLPSEISMEPSTEYRADWLWMENPATNLFPHWKSGKWVVKVDEVDVDEVYSTVKEMVNVGALPGAKCSTRKSLNHRDNYVLCIYNKDFRDEETVRSIGKLLDGSLEYDEMGYKPNFLTALGVYPETLDDFGRLESEYLFQLEDGELEPV